MKSLTTLVLVFLFFIAMICLPSASPCEETALSVVETEGSAPVTGRDLARAREVAVRDALQKAVGQVAGQWLTPQEAVKKSPLLKEHLFDQADAFIQDYRIVSEQGADVYTVWVRSTVFAESVRNELLGLGIIKQVRGSDSVSRISLTISEIHDYSGYFRCREILKERVVGIKEAILSEASWGIARFDIVTTEKVTILAERLRERLPLEIQHQDDRILEVSLR